MIMMMINQLEGAEVIGTACLPACLVAIAVLLILWT